MEIISPDLIDVSAIITLMDKVMKHVKKKKTLCCAANGPSWYLDVEKKSPTHPKF